jgi:hypothetical protein
MPKNREQHQPDEDIVDRQRLFDQVAGDEFERLLVGHLAPGAAVEVPPEGRGEEKGYGDPDHRPGGGLPERHLVLLAATDHEQVDRQHHQDDGEESHPHPPCTDCFHCMLSLSDPVRRSPRSF